MALQKGVVEEGGGADSTVGVDKQVWEELQRVMRGMDPAQLLNLVRPEELNPAASNSSARSTADAGGSDSPAESSAASAGTADRSNNGGGEEGYDPQAGQLVVLLLARIDKQPAVGADMVQIELDPSGRVSLTSPHLDALF